MPLARRLARQCLIGLDYMHRMCKIIHTDFKPENVVICLKDSEVAEIAKTGQLTTTKMFQQNESIKKLNMKIAGTLQTTTSATAPSKKEKKLTSKQSQASLFASDYDMEGMTAKQKKNLRKKLYRKRKKLEQSHNNSKLDLTKGSIDGEESKDESGDDDDCDVTQEEANGVVEAADADDLDLNIEINDVNIGVSASAVAAKKQAKASTDSVERAPDLEKVNGLLSGSGDDESGSGKDGEGQN